MVFGELNGSIFAMTNDSVEVVVDWRWPDITEFVEVNAIHQVIGTNGAVCTALIGGVELDSFQCFKGWFLHTGSIGTVSFSSVGAEITGSESFVHVSFGGQRWVMLTHGVHVYPADARLDVHVEPEHVMAFDAAGRTLDPAHREAA